MKENNLFQNFIVKISDKSAINIFYVSLLMFQPSPDY